MHVTTFTYRNSLVKMDMQVNPSYRGNRLTDKARSAVTDIRIATQKAA